MVDLQDKANCPTLEEISKYFGNSVFAEFYNEVKTRFNCDEKIEYNSCSWERGWNVKFKKAGKTLCTIYPREEYFTVMIVVGKKEKPFVEEILPECMAEMQRIYHETEEGNGQRWLTVDLEDQEELYQVFCV